MGYADWIGKAGFLVALFSATAVADLTNLSPGSYANCTYYMAFHACKTDAVDCDRRRNHTVHLARSTDGVNWSLHSTGVTESAMSDVISKGTVPDIVKYQNKLYLYYLNRIDGEGWRLERRVFDFRLNEIGTAAEVTFNSATDVHGLVDPSVVVSGGNVSLYYLPDVASGDPANCATYPCQKQIHIANGVTMEEFNHPSNPWSGTAVSTILENDPPVTPPPAFSDPDIIYRNSEKLLYVSRGRSVDVYRASTTRITPFNRIGAVSVEQGGIPGAVVAPDEKVWLYVTRSPEGSTISTIRRGVSDDGISLPLFYGETVSGEGLFGDSLISVASASVERVGFGCR